MWVWTLVYVAEPVVFNLFWEDVFFTHKGNFLSKFAGEAWNSTEIKIKARNEIDAWTY